VTARLALAGHSRRRRLLLDQGLPRFRGVFARCGQQGAQPQGHPSAALLCPLLLIEPPGGAASSWNDRAGSTAPGSEPAAADREVQPGRQHPLEAGVPAGPLARRWSREARDAPRAPRLARHFSPVRSARTYGHWGRIRSVPRNPLYSGTFRVGARGRPPGEGGGATRGGGAHRPPNRKERATAWRTGAV
jgi:hypothetical protein